MSKHLGTFKGKTLAAWILSLALLTSAFNSSTLADGLGDSLGISPHYDWKTIESAHFRVSFDEKLAPIAQRASHYLEQAHTLLTPRLKHTPKTKTQVLLLDNVDAANGLASPFQRFGIVLLCTPPENWFSIGDYDDWLRMVAIHEYTHILNMDPSNGVYEPLRYIFGDVFLPNSLWPTWMLEGYAVYIETQMTAAGRGRSSIYEAQVRAAVEAGTLDTPDFVTLDKVNGRNPYHPAGETAYLFGYELMNKVERSQEGALGEMSYRSSRRVPFFINGNLENITGKDWYQFWDEWVAETRTRMSGDIERIKAAGVTPTQAISDDGTDNASLGHAVSPDGTKIAYNLEAPDHTTGLYLKDLKTGEVKRLGRKILGVSMAFTPDSRHLVFSALNRQGVNQGWSELETIDLQTGSRRQLTDKARAKDPDISRDGKWITFTRGEMGATHLAKAPLLIEGDRLSLGPITDVVRAPMLGRISNPKFSPSGTEIAFSMHTNKTPSEEIYEIDTAGGAPRLLVSNGSFNRFPFYSSTRDLYFVSDLTGVSNVYRYISANVPPEMRTNVTTALYLPTVSNDGTFYGSRLTDRGWKLESFTLTPASVKADSVRVSAPPAPTRVPESATLEAEPTPELPVEDYSIWPSILPRQWAPVVLIYQDAAILGGQVFGFDATDRYRYLLGIAYDSDLKRADWVTWLSTRALGPTFSFLGVEQNYRTSRSTILKESDFEFSVSYPFQWTISSLTPELAYRIERTSDKFDLGAYQTSLISSDTSITGRLTYSDTESSRLGVTAESGRTITAGVRNYNIADRDSTKAAVSYSEHFETFSHVVLNPRLIGVATDRRVGPQTFGFYSNANVRVSGRSENIFSLGGRDPLDRVVIRGYPGLEYDTQTAVKAGADLDFPLIQIFRGFGTNPLFFENLSGFVFGETVYFPKDQPPSGSSLPGVGAGLRLMSEVLVRVPLVISIEYHRGLQKAAGGKGEAVFAVGLGNLGF